MTIIILIWQLINQKDSKADPYGNLQFSFLVRPLTFSPTIPPISSLSLSPYSVFSSFLFPLFSQGEENSAMEDTSNSVTATNSEMDKSSNSAAGTKSPDEKESEDQDHFSDVEIEKKIENQSNPESQTEAPNSNPNPNPGSDNSSSTAKPEPKTNPYIPNIKAQEHFPQPDQPQNQRSQPQPKLETAKSLSIKDNFPLIKKFFSERSSSFSAAITKRLASLKEGGGDGDDGGGEYTLKKDSVNFVVTEYKIPGVKVIVKLKSLEERENLKGRVAFFSRSNCRDCTAVRTFFRQKTLNFVEINIDVYPKREKELIERTRSAEVPQIFFNDKLFGGLVALNSSRNNGDFDGKLKEMLEENCPSSAPAPPPGEGDEEEEPPEDELVGIVRFLRQNVPVQDRLVKMKMVKSCFAGGDLVEAIIQHWDCGRRKAIATAKQLAKKHFFHHVFGENEFEDGKHFYRFLEHEPFIIGCFNFRNCTNDNEPMSASFLAERMMKLMSAILETYASEDRCNLDYDGISKSEEFRRYLNLARNLQRINLQLLSPEETLAFFLNLFNAMVIHAVVSIGHPEGMLDKRAFFSEFQYVVGGYAYSMSTIQNGILRHNQRPLYSLAKPLANGDRRLELRLPKFTPLIHFGLCNGTRSSPTVRFFPPQGVVTELKYAAREFFQQRGGIEIDLDKRTVHLTRIIRWYMVDFGQEKEILKWVLDYVDATKAGLLTHLLSDGSPVNIVYQNYDWSGNC